MNDWFIDLYKTYYDELHRFIFVLSEDKNIVEDIIQDTFMTLYRKQHKLIEHPCIEGWLYTTARNKTWDYLKKRNKGRKYIIELTTQSLEKTYHIDKIPINIYEVLEDFLTEEEIEILKLNTEYGFTIKEIAMHKGINPDTLQKRNYRSKIKVREILKKFFSVLFALIFLGVKLI